MTSPLLVTRLDIRVPSRPPLERIYEDVVVRALMQELAAGDIYHYLDAVTGGEFRDKIYGSLSTTSNPRGNAVLMIHFLEELRQTTAVDPLLVLVEDLETAHPSVEPVLRELRGAPTILPAGPDVFRAQRVRADGRPFLNRHTIRVTLERLLFSEGGPRVVVVRGPRRSGKSYSYQLIKHIAEQRGGFATVKVDFKGDRLPPRRVADRIVRKVRGDDSTAPTPGHEQRTRTVDFLTEWVVDHLIESGGKWCVFIDVGANDLLRGDTENLISKLVLATEDRGQDVLRVVLVDYGKPISGVKPRFLEYSDVPSPDTIAAVELGQYFRWCCEAAEVEISPLRQSLIADSIDGILGRVEVGDPQRIEKIGAAVRGLTANILEAS